MLKKTVLKNGLRVLLVPQPANPAATVLILVEAGSEYETKGINGISHFLEHLVFKGTANRPKSGDIARELESLGSEYNAFTGQEYTMYYAKAEKHKLGKILDLVSDMYLNPVFGPEEIEKERGVIIEEINMYEDTPTRRVHELFTQLLYGDQPAGWDIAGEKHIIRKLKRDDFIKYRSKFYVPKGTVIAVAGSFDRKAVLSQIKRLFGSLPGKPKVRKAKTREDQTRPRLLLKFKELQQSHLVLGVRAWSTFDKRRYALRVLAEVLGGGMSSRLFVRIREELGAAYYVRTDEEFFLDHGYMAIGAGVDIKKIEMVIKEILSELNRMKIDLVPAEELQKAKDHMIGNMILELETSDELAGFYGGQEVMTGKPLPPEEVIRRIQAVKAEEVREVARALFNDRRLNLAVIGPYRKEAPFRKILKF